jgi:hypothetical protein
MNRKGSSIVRIISNVTPWLSPIPSGYFVARSVYNHLSVPILVAIIIGLIIEFLGITSVYSYLWLTEWNISKRKTDKSAPAGIALLFCLIYLGTTITLSVVLDIFPNLAHYSIGVFPILGLVGAFNLALMSFQNNRENLVLVAKESAKFDRQNRTSNIFPAGHSFPKIDGVDYTPLLAAANATRHQKRIATKHKLVELLQRNPMIGVTEISRLIGHSRTSVYAYLDELMKDGILIKGNAGLEVINQ